MTDRAPSETVRRLCSNCALMLVTGPDLLCDRCRHEARLLLVVEAATEYAARVDYIQSGAAATEHHHNNPEWLRLRSALRRYRLETKA